jgi:hypothetical protein
MPACPHDKLARVREDGADCCGGVDALFELVVVAVNVARVIR